MYLICHFTLDGFKAEPYPTPAQAWIALALCTLLGEKCWLEWHKRSPKHGKG